MHGDELTAAISRVAQFADERSRAVRMRLEKGELKLSASSTETGESEDSIEIDYNGETLAIGFNAQYLLDFLKATGSRRRAPGVQRRPIRRPAPPRRERGVQVPVYRDADEDLRTLTLPSVIPVIDLSVGND